MRITVAHVRLTDTNTFMRDHLNVSEPACTQSWVSKHYSTPSRSSITHCPAVQNLKRAAAHLFPVSVDTDPRCCSRNHIKNHTPYACIYPVQLVDGNACIFMSPIRQSRSSRKSLPVYPSPLASTRWAKQIAGWHERRRVFLSQEKLS